MMSLVLSLTGSLAPSVDEKKLTVYFSNFGKVESCRVIRDKATNISKGFAFVTFLSAQVSHRLLGNNPWIIDRLTPPTRQRK